MNLVVSETAIAEPDARFKVSLPSAERAYTRSCFFEPGITATRGRRDKLYALRRVSNYPPMPAFTASRKSSYSAPPSGETAGEVPPPAPGVVAVYFSNAADTSWYFSKRAVS